METKVDGDVIARICRKRQISNFFVVAHLSRGGDLAVLWKNDINDIIYHGMNDT